MTEVTEDAPREEHGGAVDDNDTRLPARPVERLLGQKSTSHSARKWKKPKRHQLLDEEASGDDSDADGGGELDTAWDATNLDPDEFMEINSCEGQIVRLKGTLAKILEEAKVSVRALQAEQEREGSARDEKRVVELRAKCGEAQQRITKYTKAIAAHEGRIAEIRAKADSFINDAEESDSEPDEAVVMDDTETGGQSDGAEDDESEVALDRKMDGDRDIAMSDAAVRDLVRKPEMTEKEEARAAAILEQSRALAAARKRGAQSQVEAAADEDADAKCNPIAKIEDCPDISAIVFQVSKLALVGRSMTDKESWATAIRQIRDENVTHFTRQRRAESDYRYCYRYTTEQAQWEVAADTITVMKTDKKGRQVPLVVYADLAVSGPKSAKLRFMRAYSGPLEALYNRWELYAHNGMSAIDTILRDFISDPATRKACWFGLLLLLRVFQVSNPHTC